MGLRILVNVAWSVLRYGLQGALEKAEEELAELTRDSRRLQEEQKCLVQQLQEQQEGSH